MPTPKTIEELLNMKPCPFEDGQIITVEEWDYANDNDLIHRCLWEEAYDFVFNSFGLAWEHPYLKPFKMPDGYFYLPIGMELGLPLGRRTTGQIRTFMYRLSFGIVKSYIGNRNCAIVDHGREFCFSDMRFDNTIVNIHKQPPNLYNPLDQQAEEVPAQPAKETEKMALPWQDISTLESYLKEHGGYVLIEGTTQQGIPRRPDVYYFDWALSFIMEIKRERKRWLPIPTQCFTPPEAKTVEAPVEPERVSAEEFARSPVGKWVTHSGLAYCQFNERDAEGMTVQFNDYQTFKLVVQYGQPIYATDPTAWLASKAKQEGKN
jgi:hypothetical protein